MDGIDGFHAHVYFDAASRARARELVRAAAARFDLCVGRMHEREVGPHPRWSCQLSVGNEQFGEVIAWLAMHRDGLTLFVHPNTDDAIADHTSNAIWMGELLELKTDVLR